MGTRRIRKYSRTSGRERGNGKRLIPPHESEGSRPPGCACYLFQTAAIALHLDFLRKQQALEVRRCKIGPGYTLSNATKEFFACCQGRRMRRNYWMSFSEHALSLPVRTAECCFRFSMSTSWPSLTCRKQRHGDKQTSRYLTYSGNHDSAHFCILAYSLEALPTLYPKRCVHCVDLRRTVHLDMQYTRCRRRDFERLKVVEHHTPVSPVSARPATRPRLCTTGGGATRDPEINSGKDTWSNVNRSGVLRSWSEKTGNSTGVSYGGKVTHQKHMM